MQEIGWKVASGLFKRGVLVAGTYSKAQVIRIEPALGNSDGAASGDAEIGWKTPSERWPGRPDLSGVVMNSEGRPSRAALRLLGAGVLLRRPGPPALPRQRLRPAERDASPELRLAGVGWRGDLGEIVAGNDEVDDRSDGNGSGRRGYSRREVQMGKAVVGEVERLIR